MQSNHFMTTACVLVLLAVLGACTSTQTATDGGIGECDNAANQGHGTCSSQIDPAARVGAAAAYSGAR